MNIFQSFFYKSTIGLPLMLMAIIFGLPSSQSAPFKELLPQIADQYSAPLDGSSLHSTIQKNTEMLSEIKSGFEDLSKLDQSKIDVFSLVEKTFELSDEQITALGKADYFDFNGTEKVKYFFEKFIMQNEMYPIEFGSYEAVKGVFTPDALLEDLRKKTSTDPRKVALGTVLRKVKTIVDFFYAQFNHFADPKSGEKVNETLNSLKYIASIHQIMITTITMILIIILKVLLVQK